MEFVEALFGEVLASVGKDQIAVVDALFFAPSGIENGGVDGRHAGDVGIGFGSDIEATGARTFDHRNALQRVAQAGAVHVNDVERCAGDGGGADDFLRGLNGGTWIDAASAAHVRIDRQLALGGHAEHVDDFETGSAGSVFNAHPDAESAGIELVAQTLLNALDLLGRGRLVGGGPAFRQNSSGGQGRAENQGARGYVAGGAAVVDERVSLLGIQERGDVGGADLHF